MFSSALIGDSSLTPASRSSTSDLPGLPSSQVLEPARSPPYIPPERRLDLFQPGYDLTETGSACADLGWCCNGPFKPASLEENKYGKSHWY